MATLKSIQFKRSKIAGAKPTAAQLDEGELAINLKDRLLFTKDDTGAIIDLGFAKGGNIDGNVIHKGNYTQTGAYTIAGAISQTSGHFTTTGSITATGDVTAKSRLMTDMGEVLVRSNGTAHVRFQDLADSRERGIIYSQNRTGDTKQILNVRVQDYANSTSNTFAFNGDGLFYAPSISGGTSVKSPVIYTNTVDTGNKSALDYDISSLANNNPASSSATAINYLRISRHAVNGIRYRELNNVNGISWHSISTAGTAKYLWSFNADGDVKTSNSLSVGLPGDSSGYSTLGPSSIALGDNNTGLKWKQDGQFHTINNGAYTLLTTPTEVTSLKQLVAGYSTNGSDLILPTTQNYPLVIVNTTNDKNSFGDGQTLLGYHQSGKYHHYFRGKGTTNINTTGGLLVTPGNVEVRGGSVNIDGLSNASTVLFKGNTTGYSSVDNIELKVWGDTFNTVDGRRKNVMEISDATGWMHYIQRTTAGKVESYLNGAMDVKESINVGKEVNASGTIAGNAINALRIWNDDYGAIFRRSGNNLHIIPTEFGKGKTGNIGPLRPFSMALDTGKVIIPNLEARQVSGVLEFISDHGSSYANQNTTKAPLYQTLDSTSAQAFYPITKQKNTVSNVTVTQGMDRTTSEYRIVAQGDLLGDGAATGLKYWRFTKEGNFMAQNRLYAGTASMDTTGNIFGSIWNKYSGATNLDAAVNTRVGKSGDTMTGKLVIEAPGAGLLLLAPNANNSSHIFSSVAGVNSWFIGKGGQSDTISFYNYKTTSGIDLSDTGSIAFNPSGVSLVNMSSNRMWINGTKWADTNPGAINGQFALEAPLFVEHGELNGNVYYPIVKGRSSSAGFGYTSSVELGTLRSGVAGWATGCIIVRSAENTPEQGHPAAIYQFGAYGDMVVPGSINTPRIGLGSVNTLGGYSITIGDNDSGIRSAGDGVLEVVCNNTSVMYWEPGALVTQPNKNIHSNGGMYVRDNIDVNDVYIRSDIRCKSEIKLIDNAQEKSKLLGGYTYLLKNSVTDEVKPSAGLIAQEVQKVLPELVSEDKETGLLRLNYNGIIGLNTATINEHTDEIKELKSEIAELKALIKSLL